MPPPSKRRKTSQVEEITFNDEARAEYLTGFHKRKLARQKAAQEAAARKEKEDKIQERKEMRERRKRELEDHVATVNAMMRQANKDMGVDDSEDSGRDEGDGEEEWGGFTEPTEEINHEEEYIDEDKYTTVTIEGVNITKDGFTKVDSGEEDDSSEEQQTTESLPKSKGEQPGSKKRTWTKDKPSRDKLKKKKKKFRYESKADRKVTRLKERSRNNAQAKARRG